MAERTGAETQADPQAAGARPADSLAKGSAPLANGSPKRRSSCREKSAGTFTPSNAAAAIVVSV